MTYLASLIYVAIIYIRPGELVPAWGSLHIAAIALGIAAVLAAFSLLMEPRPFANLPLDLCFLGFCVAGLVSSAAGGTLATGYAALGRVIPLVGFYLLIRLAVRTERQLRGLIVVLVALTLFQAGNGILQHWTGVGLGGSRAVVEGAIQTDQDSWDDSGAQVVTRIEGTGIFGDPNDLAMSLLLVFPFLFTTILGEETSLTRRTLGLGALATLLYALFLTQSRGGLLGLAALCAAYAYRRFGRAAAMFMVVLAVVALAAAPGRLRAMSSSEESAQGRIQAWSAGLEMLKSKPLLGVGLGRFTAYHERVAHNAFVHVLGEVGLIGGFFFVGMFYWFFVSTGASRDIAGATGSPLARDIWASGVGAVVCACFLSRQLDLVLYVPLALAAVRTSVEWTPGRDRPGDRWWDWPAVLFVSAGVVVVAYVAVRVLAVWSRV